MGMHDMSRKSKTEYIKVKKLRYAEAGPAKKSRILDALNGVGPYCDPSITSPKYRYIF